MNSIAMTTYNGLPFVREQLQSIRMQMKAEDELIISDNGSTDGTWEWLLEQAQADPRLKPERYLEQKGVIANFGHALTLCRGDLIFLSDQDDVWLPGRLDKFVELFRESPRLVLAQADAELIDGEGRVLAPSYFSLRRCGSGIWKNFYKNTWQGCSLCFRKGLLALALPFPKSIPMHDMWLGLIAEMTGEVCFLPLVLTRYRRHEHNESGLRPAGWRQVVQWRIQLAAALVSKLSYIRHEQRLSKRR
ncbi:MAG: glycosyltransferase family 2 protein [Clostridiaceae bacterium]|nr:glycosyltransferase family 2 protein [Clostridiaceae bacterium]